MAGNDQPDSVDEMSDLKFYTVKEVAHAFRASEKRVRWLEDKDLLPRAPNMGGSVLFLGATCKAFVAQLREEAEIKQKDGLESVGGALKPKSKAPKNQ